MTRSRKLTVALALSQMALILLSASRSVAIPDGEVSSLSRVERKFTVLLAYSPIDLILPSKTGGSLTWNEDDQVSYDLEYMGANLSVPFVVDDLGSFKDRRVSLTKRAFRGRTSFHFFYGLSYFETTIHLGNQYLDQVSGAPRSIDLVGVKSLGVVWGIGNRWIFKPGFTVGLDWFSWAQPLIVVDRDQEILNYISNEDTRDTIRETLNLTSYFPRFVLLKVQLGWSF